MSGPVVRIVDGVTAQRSGDKMIVLNASGSAMSTLNPTGAAIWGLLATEPTIDVLAERAGELFDGVDRDELHRDLAAFIGDMVGLGLVSSGD